jgi:sialate O-acetylesterase
VALAKTYGQQIEYAGPLYERMEIKDNTVVLHFTQVGTGLVAKGGEPLKRFAIAGADQKFIWGDARIVDRTVVVSSPQVPKPVAVRYAWDINPDGCNLYNAADLPASPFRTDEWKLEFAQQ